MSQFPGIIKFCSSDALTQKPIDEALRRAVAYLRERKDVYFVNDQPGIFTTHQLATLVEQLARDLGTPDKPTARRLWGIFGIGGAWDDAQGDADLGQLVFELLDAAYRPT
jgi:hypothetical protein